MPELRAHVLHRWWLLVGPRVWFRACVCPPRVCPPRVSVWVLSVFPGWFESAEDTPPPQQRMDRQGATRLLLPSCGNDAAYAEALERALFDQGLPVAEYRARVRHLAYNLRSNAALVRGHPPEEVSAMTAAQLRPPQRSAMEVSAAEGLGAQPAAERGMLQCNKCKSWDTE